VASRRRSKRRLRETARVVAVEDIPAFWMAALFAGRRRKGGLGRSVVPSWASPHVGRRADDSGCPKDAEEGNVVAHAPPSVCTGSRTIRRACVRQTRPSLGPSTRARRSSLCTARCKTVRGGAFVSVSRLGKPTRVGGTSTGVERTGAARLAACHRIRKDEGVARETRKEVEASVPARIARARVVIRTSCFRRCRSRQATSDLE